MKEVVVEMVKVPQKQRPTLRNSNDPLRDV
jgi:hypothetical protein